MGLVAEGIMALIGPPTGSSVVRVPLSGTPTGNFQTFARLGYMGNAIIFSGVNLISTSASEPHIIGKRWRRNRRRVATTAMTAGWTNEYVSDSVARTQIRAEGKWLTAHGVTNHAGRRLLDALMVRNGFWEEVDDHPLVRLLNNPNPFMSRGQLWGTATMDYHLAGNAYVYKARYKDGLLAGAVGELWRLRPDRVRVVPDDQGGYIKGYEYGDQYGQKTFLPARDIMHFKTRNPLDEYYGMPPLMPVLGRMTIDSYMERYLRSFYETGGVGPGAILSTEDGMDQSDKDDIRDRWRRQFGAAAGNFLELLILDNAKSVNYTQMGLDRGLRDALPKEIDAQTEARCAMVLGVPGSILGLIIGYESSSYANKRQDWQVLWDVKMTPMLSDFDDVLNLSMTPEFAGVDEVCFDTSDIRALQEDEDALHDRARKNQNAGLWSFQKARLVTGEPEEPSPDELFFVPSSHTVMPYSRMGEELEVPDEPGALLARGMTMLAARVGRPRIEEDEGARAVYVEAMELRTRNPEMTWRQIASRVGVVERTLRDYRHRFEDDD